MYESALSRWGLPPEYLNRRWTEELLLVMLEASILNARASLPVEVDRVRISNDEFFARHGIKVSHA